MVQFNFFIPPSQPSPVIFTPFPNLPPEGKGLAALCKALPPGIPITIDIFQDDHGRENREKPFPLGDPDSYREGKGVIAVQRKIIDYQKYKLNSTLRSNSN